MCHLISLPKGCQPTNVLMCWLGHQWYAISVQGVLQVVQHSLVLMGNANMLLTEARRDGILHSVDKLLVECSKDCTASTGEYLFGKDFTSLRSENEKLLSQVVSLVRCYHPYDTPRQSNLGQTNKEFFSKRPCWQLQVGSPSLHPKEICPQETRLQL